MIQLTRRSLLSLTAAPALRAAHWPGFRGSGDSHHADGPLPVSWGAGRNIAWTADLPGYGQSSPVVWDRRVFITSVTGARKETLHVSCFDLATGRTLWTRDFPATQTGENSKTVSKAAPTPAVDARRLYVFFESGDLLALTHSGEPLWSRKLTEDYGPFEGNHGVGNSPRLGRRALYLPITHGGPCYLLAVDPATGKNRWKSDLPRATAWTTPALLHAGGSETVILSANGSVTAHDGASGRQLWIHEGLKGNTISLRHRLRQPRLRRFERKRRNRRSPSRPPTGRRTPTRVAPR
jgi:outer membrane protein assembly factor BamB